MSQFDDNPNRPDGPVGAGEPTPDTASHALLERMAGALQLVTGERIYVRPIQPDDTERLQAFHLRLSTDSIVFRFFRYVPTLPQADAERFTHVDYESRMALVATEDPSTNGRLLGVVRYERTGPDSAEVAFVVEDHWQGHGIATALLRRLAPYARARGITHLVAITLATNAKMLEVLQRAGYPFISHYSDAEFEVTLDISRPASGEPTL